MLQERGAPPADTVPSARVLRATQEMPTRAAAPPRWIVPSAALTEIVQRLSLALMLDVPTCAPAHHATLAFSATQLTCCRYARLLACAQKAAAPRPILAADRRPAQSALVMRNAPLRKPVAVVVALKPAEPTPVDKTHYVNLSTTLRIALAHQAIPEMRESSVTQVNIE